MKRLTLKHILIPALLFLSFTAHAATTTVIALGDSLTEGYGIEKAAAYPALVETKFQTAGKNIKILNAGISGSTSASSLSRLKWYLRSQPQVLFLALGANDGLRGFPIAATKKNLRETIDLAKKSGLKVLLAGMYLPPNYGEKYTREFRQMYEELARETQSPFMPFLLQGVAGVKDLNQEDGIHPNVKGHAIIANQVYEFLNKNLAPQPNSPEISKPQPNSSIKK